MVGSIGNLDYFGWGDLGGFCNLVTRGGGSIAPLAPKVIGR